MDAHLFRLFSLVANPFLLDSRVEKIQEPAPGLLVLSLFAKGEKRQLYMRYGKKDQFCFLGTSRYSASSSPPAHIMRIRKYFNNHRISSVVFQFCQRKLWLLAGGAIYDRCPDKTVWLCLDLVAGPELYFLSHHEVPLPDKPDWPAGGILASALEQWRDWPVLTPALRRALARLDEPDQKALMEDLRIGGGNIFLYSKADEAGRARICRASAWPLAPAGGESQEEAEGENLLAAFEKAGNDLVLDKIFSAGQDRLLGPLRKRIARLRKLLARLDDDEKRLNAMRCHEEPALALCENIWLYEKDAHLDSLTLQRDGKEYKIALDKRFSIIENMRRFFHTARRGKRGLAMLAGRRQAISAEIAELERPQAIFSPNQDKQRASHGESALAAASLQNSLPKNVQALASSDGYVLLRGKDAKGNKAALKLASPHDLWAHVEQGPGAHVIIRRRHPADIVPEATLNEAGSLAACKSWLKDSATASIMYAEARHVKPARSGPAGKVVIDRLAMTRIVHIERGIEQRLLNQKPPA